MKLSLAVGLVCGLAFAPACVAQEGEAAAGAGEAPRPNIVLMVADDLGYGDVGVFRGSDLWDTVKPGPPRNGPPETPALDGLAAEGMMLTDFHSNDSVCSPTRAAILTGRYNHRTGIVNVLGQLGDAIKKVTPAGEEPFAGLEESEVTVAELFKAAGYRTGIFGKWHLGPLETHHPLDQGFDVFAGTSGNAGDNFAMKYGPGTDGTSYYFRGRERADAPGLWFNDVVADDAGAFMAEAAEAGEPFFAYVPFPAPHRPLIGRGDEELAVNWEGTETHGAGPRDDKHVAYVEVVEGLDGSVERLLAALDATGQADNTLVVFTSDNGPIDFGSTQPYRGRKSNLLEGGTRVPTIVRWPGRVEPGTRSDQLAMTADLLPTLASAAGVPTDDAPPLDGADLVPQLTGEAEAEDRRLFWEKPRGVHMNKFDRKTWVVRDGDLALVSLQGDKAPALYDPAADPLQKKDIAKQHAAKVDELTAAIKDWRADVYADSPWDVEAYTQRFIEAGIIEDPVDE